MLRAAMSGSPSRNELVIQSKTPSQLKKVGGGSETKEDFYPRTPLAAALDRKKSAMQIARDLLNEHTPNWSPSPYKMRQEITPTAQNIGQLRKLISTLRSQLEEAVKNSVQLESKINSEGLEIKRLGAVIHGAERDIESKTSEISQLKEAHALSLTALQQEHSSALELAQLAVRKELDLSHRQQIEALESNHKEGLIAKLKELEGSHALKLSSTVDGNTSQLVSQHSQEIELLKQEYSAKLESDKTALSQHHISKLTEAVTTAKSEVSLQFEERHRELRDSQALEINELTDFVSELSKKLREEKSKRETTTLNLKRAQRELEMVTSENTKLKEEIAGLVAPTMSGTNLSQQFSEPNSGGGMRDTSLLQSQRQLVPEESTSIKQVAASSKSEAKVDLVTAAPSIENLISLIDRKVITTQKAAREYATQINDIGFAGQFDVFKKGEIYLSLPKR